MTNAKNEKSRASVVVGYNFIALWFTINHPCLRRSRSIFMTNAKNEKSRASVGCDFMA
jgi:hypothetical protein